MAPVVAAFHTSVGLSTTLVPGRDLKFTLAFWNSSMSTNEQAKSTNWTVSRVLHLLFFLHCSLYTTPTRALFSSPPLNSEAPPSPTFSATKGVAPVFLTPLSILRFQSVPVKVWASPSLTAPNSWHFRNWTPSLSSRGCMLYHENRPWCDNAGLFTEGDRVHRLTLKFSKEGVSWIVCGNRLPPSVALLSAASIQPTLGRYSSFQCRAYHGRAITVHNGKRTVASIRWQARPFVSAMHSAICLHHYQFKAVWLTWHASTQVRIL